MPSTSVTRPPMPQAALVDAATGNVTREWWRWFASIGTASLATTSSITNITNTITNIIEEAQPIPLLDDPGDADQVMRQALLLRTPGECACDLDDAAKRALRFIPPTEAIGPQLDDLLRKVLELVRPLDQAAADQLQQALQLAPDPSSDQLALLAQVLAMPQDAPRPPAPRTVAQLPGAAGNTGARLFVTDATVTTFASIVAGTGANGVPVYSDGTNWRIG